MTYITVGIILLSVIVFGTMMLDPVPEPFVLGPIESPVTQLSPGATHYTITTASGEVSSGYVEKKDYSGEVWAQHG